MKTVEEVRAYLKNLKIRKNQEYTRCYFRLEIGPTETTLDIDGNFTVEELELIVQQLKELP